MTSAYGPPELSRATSTTYASRGKGVDQRGFHDDLNDTSVRPNTHPSRNGDNTVYDQQGANDSCGHEEGYV